MCNSDVSGIIFTKDHIVKIGGFSFTKWSLKKIMVLLKADCKQDLDSMLLNIILYLECLGKVSMQNYFVLEEIRSDFLDRHMKVVTI